MRRATKALSNVLLRMYLTLYYEIVLCANLADSHLVEVCALKEPRKCDENWSHSVPKL